MGETRVRVLVVGAGFMGGLHARTLRGSRGAELCGVVDHSGPVAATTAEELEVPGFTGLDQAIEKARPDAVIIATPDPAHRAAAETVIEAELPLLVEKPLATTVADAEAIIALAERRGVPLMPGHLLRFDLRYARLAEAVRSGELGRPVVVEAARWGLTSFGARVRDVTTPLWHFLIHDIDAVQWVAGGTIATVAGAIAVESPAGPSAITATGTLSTGASFQLAAGWTLPEGSLSVRTTFGLHGEDAHAEITARGESFVIAGPDKAYRPGASAWPDFHGRVDGMLRREVDHFVTAVADGAPFVIAPQEAVAAVRSAVALEEATVTRRLS